MNPMNPKNERRPDSGAALGTTEQCVVGGTQPRDPPTPRVEGFIAQPVSSRSPMLHMPKQFPVLSQWATSEDMTGASTSYPTRNQPNKLVWASANPGKAGMFQVMVQMPEGFTLQTHEMLLAVPRPSPEVG